MASLEAKRNFHYGLPEGAYEIEAWHERLGTQRKQVEVKSGETTTVDFTFTRPQK